MITPDGSTLIVTLRRGSAREVAAFSARTGRALRVQDGRLTRFSGRWHLPLDDGQSGNGSPRVAW